MASCQRGVEPYRHLLRWDPDHKVFVAYEQEELTSRNLPQISPNLPPLSAQTLDW